MADKKILQLGNQAPVLSDTSVFAEVSGTFGYTFMQLLALIQSNLSTGAVFTFGSASIPSNTVGSNGDVYVKTDTGQFAQKLAGIWAVVYTIVQGVVGSKIYYGSTVPDNSLGINGDTYLRTVGGVFYSKIIGIWVAEFSMATGPVGPAGANGTNGTNGTNGLTILSGTTNPSNGLGVNGDFYINTTTWFIFGPKAAGAWPAGVSIVGPPSNPDPITITAGTTPMPLTIAFPSATYPNWNAVKSATEDYDNTYPVKYIMADQHFIINAMADGAGKALESYLFTINP